MTSDVRIRLLEFMYFSMFFEFGVGKSLAKIVKKVGKVSIRFRTFLCKLAEMNFKARPRQGKGNAMPAKSAYYLKNYMEFFNGLRDMP